MRSHLETHPPRRGELKRIAQELGITPRTLRNWRQGGAACPPGRPPYDAESRQRARVNVERARRALPRGHQGWRSVVALLAREGIVVPTRLVQESLRELARERAQETRARLEENRVTVHVHASDAIWALDQTLFARDEHDRKLCALALRDACEPHTLGLSLGPPAKGVDVARLLESTAGERGTWPFVIQLDNGPENRNDAVEECLEHHHVIVIWNQPRTPQHNPRAEHGFGDLKRAAGLEGRALRLGGPAVAVHASREQDGRQTPQQALVFAPNPPARNFAGGLGAVTAAGGRSEAASGAPRNPSDRGLPRTRRVAGAQPTRSDGRTTSGERRSTDATYGAAKVVAPRVPRTRAEVAGVVLCAWYNLDAMTPRARLGGLTPLEVDRIAPRAQALASRERFYEEVREERMRIAHSPLRGRARRAAEREAAWAALERYGLVTRTRGGRIAPTPKAERIS